MPVTSTTVRRPGGSPGQPNVQRLPGRSSVFAGPSRAPFTPGTDQLQVQGVEVGGAVTAQSVPDMTVQVAAGSVVFGNLPVSFNAQGKTIAAADPIYDRMDIISVDNAGTVWVEQGTAQAGGVFPPVSTYVALAYVYVFNQAHASYTGTIVQDAITDARSYILRHVSPYRITGLWYGPIAGAIGTSNAYATGECYFVPFFCGKSLPVQSIGCNMTAAGTTGGKARLGVFLDDGAGTLSLFSDAGQVALDGVTGGLSLPISLTFPPGWIWLACAFQTLGASIPTMSTLNRMSESPAGSSSLDNARQGSVGAMKVTGVTGGLPSNPSGFSFNVTNAPGVWVQAA